MGKKIVRIFAIIVVSIILLNVILYLILSIPVLQKKAADIAIEKLKPKINTEAALEGIRIKLFNKIELNGFYLEDRQKDTLLYADRILVRIHALELLKNRVYVDKLGIEGLVAKVHRASSSDSYNFQFLFDSFGGKEKDTTQVKKSDWRITVDKLSLKEASLHYHIDSQPHTPGLFNVNHIDLKHLNLRGKADFEGVDKMEAEIAQLDFNEINAGIILHQLKAKLKGKGNELQSNRLSLQFNNTELEAENLLYNRETQDFSVRAESKNTDPHDIALFTPRVAHLGKSISFVVEGEGSIPRATLDHLQLNYGDETTVSLTGKVDDFRNIEQSDLLINIQHLSVTQDDLQSFIRIGPSDFISPSQLAALGDMTLRMRTEGRMSNFHYDGSIRTEQGDVLLSGNGVIRNNFRQMLFQGPLRAKDVRLAEILGEKAGLGNATLGADVKLRIEPSLVTVGADGNIESAYYKGYHYTDLILMAYSGNNAKATCCQ